MVIIARENVEGWVGPGGLFFVFVCWVVGAAGDMLRVPVVGPSF